MGSNRTLRHRHGIRGLTEEFHRLFCRLTRSMRRARYLCEADILLLDQGHSWASLTNESITLPAGLTMEAANIVFAIHRRISDILEVYGGPLHEPPYLMDFFEDMLNKYISPFIGPD
jgi:hypothetical protein